MENPWFIKGSLGANSITYSPGSIQLVETRTLSLTVQGTAGSSVGNNLRVHVLYSPDGRSLDTDDYATFDVPYSAGNTTQKTVDLDVPEHGYIYLKLENLSSADSWSNIKVWYTIQSYPKQERMGHGAITQDTFEEQLRGEVGE